MAPLAGDRFAPMLPEAEVQELTKAQLLNRVRQMGKSIEPLTSSVSSTLSILKRTWPGTQPRPRHRLIRLLFPQNRTLWSALPPLGRTGSPSPSHLAPPSCHQNGSAASKAPK